MTATRSTTDELLKIKTQRASVRFDVLAKVVQANQERLALEILDGIAKKSFSIEILNSQSTAYLILKNMLIKKMFNATGKYLDLFHDNPLLLIGPNKDFAILYLVAHYDPRLFISILDSLKVFFDNKECLAFRAKKDESTLLHVVASNPEGWKIIPKILKELPELVNVTDINGRSPLFEAIDFSASNAAFLINRGANLHQRDKKSLTPAAILATLPTASLLKICSYLNDEKKRQVLNAIYKIIQNDLFKRQKNIPTLLKAVGLLSLRQLIIATHELKAAKFNSRTKISQVSRRSNEDFFLRNESNEIVFEATNIPVVLYKCDEKTIPLFELIAAELPSYMSQASAIDDTNRVVLTKASDLNILLTALTELIDQISTTISYNKRIRNMVFIGSVSFLVLLLVYEMVIKKNDAIFNVQNHLPEGFFSLILLAIAIISFYEPHKNPLAINYKQTYLHLLKRIENQLELMKFYNPQHEKQVDKYLDKLRAELKIDYEKVDITKTYELLIEVRNFLQPLKSVILSRNPNGIFYNATPNVQPKNTEQLMKRSVI